MKKTSQLLAGEWQEHGEEESTLYVEPIPKSKTIELYTLRQAESGDYDAQRSYIFLTPGQARSVAAKLLEMADSLEKQE